MCKGFPANLLCWWLNPYVYIARQRFTDHISVKMHMIHFAVSISFFRFQGTILDRIDYNIEHTAVQVDKGLKQLQKAEKYQKKNRKMYIILILALLIIILIIILVSVKR